jgi:hypothetical protein
MCLQYRGARYCRITEASSGPRGSAYSGGSFGCLHVPSNSELKSCAPNASIDRLPSYVGSRAVEVRGPPASDMSAFILPAIQGPPEEPF